MCLLSLVGLRDDEIEDLSARESETAWKLSSLVAQAIFDLYHDRERDDLLFRFVLRDAVIGSYYIFDTDSVAALAKTLYDLRLDLVYNSHRLKNSVHITTCLIEHILNDFNFASRWFDACERREEGVLGELVDEFKERPKVKKVIAGFT